MAQSQYGHDRAQGLEPRHQTLETHPLLRNQVVVAVAAVVVKAMEVIAEQATHQALMEGKIMLQMLKKLK